MGQGREDDRGGVVEEVVGRGIEEDRGVAVAISPGKRWNPPDHIR